MVMEVAYSLNMPLAEVMEMQYELFQSWVAYFERRPVGWREDIRFLRILQSLGYKGKGDEIFPAIASLNEGERIARRQLAENEILTSNLKKSTFFSKMLGAQGGVNIFNPEANK